MKLIVKTGRSWIVYAALAASAMLLPGCGGGGGGGGGGSTPTGPTSSTSFTATSGSGTNSIFMASGSSGSSAVFRLDVRTANVSDLYGAAFDVVYPSSILSFNGSAIEGAFLGSGNTTFNVVESPPGNLIIAVSRLGGGGGADGSGTLVSLDFTITASGGGDFRFTNRGAFGQGGASKPNLSWIEGSITTVR